MTTYIEELWKLWETYVKNYVIGMEHYHKPTFHSVLGVVNQIDFCWGAQVVSTRTHPFLLDNSSIGKGQEIKSAHFLIDGMPGDVLGTIKVPIKLKSKFLHSVTEARLIGSQQFLGKKVIKNKQTGQSFSVPDVVETPALAKEYDFITFSEGSNLFNKNPYYSGVRKALLMITDEPGWIDRDLKFSTGSGKFKSRSTIMTGSVMNYDIENSILQEGLFQRFFDVFKILSEKELDNVQDNLWDMLKADYLVGQSDAKNFYDKLTEICKEWKNKYKIVGGWNRVIEIDKDCISVLKEQGKELRKKYFKEQFSGKLQNTITSFYGRVPIDICKIATHEAVYNLKDKVDKDSFKYGFGVIGEHCKSVFELLSYIDKTLKERKQTILPQLDAEKIVVDILKKGEMSREELLTRLQAMYDNNRWLYAKSGTINFLEGLVGREIIEREYKGRVGVSGKVSFFKLKI